MADIIRVIADEFPHNENLVYLNHAGIGRWPMRTAHAVRDFAEENASKGAIHSVDWAKRASALRVMLAELINANSNDEIAFLKNTSEALSVVAYGIDWQADDNIVVGRQEFPSNRIIWESLQRTKQIEVRLVDLYASPTPEQALIDATDKHTRLMAVSSIQYATGYRTDLEFLGQYCHPRNILFCVDAIQSLGASAIDVQSSCIDFLAADAHKWLLAAEGIALFYCKKPHIRSLQLNEYGWNMLEDSNNYDALYNEPNTLKWKIKKNAERFECGSSNHLGIYALHASLSLLTECGIANVYSRVNRNINYLNERLNRNRFTSLTPREEIRRGGIFTFKLAGLDNRTLFNYLTANKVFCAYRGGGIRLSPHFYNTTDELDIVLRLLHEYV